MVDIQILEKEIVERLKPLDPDKIILFGSYAYGEPDEESDVDLYVVTKDDYIPKSWKEKNQLYLKIAKQIRDLREDFSIDLIVHSRAMYELLKKSKSSFYKDTIQKGISLI